MEIGGRTQYLTRVQGMPQDILTQINTIVRNFLFRNFLWDSKRPNINTETLHQTIAKGGKKCLNLNLRNEAIEFMRLKNYLKPTRPTWAYFADELIKMNAQKNVRTDLPGTIENIFTQTWRPKLNQYSSIPAPIKRMIKTAQKYGTIIDAPEICQEVKLTMPIWYHVGIGEEKIGWNMGS